MEDADSEIEAVCSIWDGVQVDKLTEPTARRVTAKIRPLEDGMIAASVLLECSIFEGYPSIHPRVKLTNPRGIGEPEFQRLCGEIDGMIERNTDEMPIICEIFQHCSDFLGEHQHVNMDCSICLLALSDAPIIVTSCEHFMHSACFCRYLNECSTQIRKEIDGVDLPQLKERIDRNVFCPVCREILTEEDDEDVDFEKRISKIIANAKRNQKSLPNPKRRISTTKEDVTRTIRSWREQQNRLAQIYAKQKQKGGIIDVEEEKKRREFYIETGIQPGETTITAESDQQIETDAETTES